MKRRKMHMLLGTLLLVGCLAATVGVAFARYRDNWNRNMGFQADQVGRVQLGTVTEGQFSEASAQWMLKDDQWQLSFAVANGAGKGDFATYDQHIHLQVVSSQGTWNTGTPLKLMVGEQTYTASATPITQGSALHTQFGDGWLIRFLDSNGNEYTGQLPGNGFSCIAMQLSVDADAVTDTSLLQLRLTTEVQ